MCLSTVYKNEVSESTAIMGNVMEIECQGDKVILTDLMGRQMTVEATLLRASLTDGFVILKTE